MHFTKNALYPEKNSEPMGLFLKFSVIFYEKVVRIQESLPNQAFRRSSENSSNDPIQRKEIK